MTGLQQETLERMGEYFGQFQITPKQQEAPPEPVSTVPFNRDPEFIDRGTLLDEINERLPKLSSDGNYSNSRSRIALVGLGGVGKSQLAIEYSYRIRTQSAKTWVFWIHASNAARFEQSYREIADRAKITGRHDPKANIFKLVCDWLQDAKHEHWVLILDNVDDYGFLHAPIPVKPEGQADNRDGFKQPLSTFIPQCQHGLLVMTTRSRSVASRFVDDSDIITVNPMDNSQASALMEKKLGMPANKEDILKLTEALEFMPLAIVQAAAYIKQRTPRASVPQYLEELQKSDRKRARLLDHEAGHRQRDWEAKNSILATWQISFDHIQETRPSAADLLSLMSFFDRQGISEELLLDVKTQKDGSNSDDDSITDSDFDDGFEDDIMTLRDYSFISISQDAKVFEMHRLVQLSTRTWFETCGQIEHWKEQFISKLYREFPSGEYENWGKCQLLFPHVKSAMSQRPSSQESLQEWARLLDSGVIYALGKGNVIGIEPMAVKAMKAYKKIFGAEHPDTLMSMKNLASTFQKLGRLHEAETLEVQVLQTRKRVLDAEHPETLISMASLALTFYELGRVQEAEALVVQVLEAHKRVFGVEHPHTLMSMNNLASIFGNLGRFQEAEALEVQVLETQKRLLGAEHPHTLMSMKNLASMFWNLGRFQEAEALEVQALDACKRVLGAEHPDTLASMNNLASMFYNLGRLQEAETLEVQALDIRKRVLGAEHPDTLMSMNNLALKSHNLGRLQEAEPLEIQMLATCKRVLSAKHSYTLKSMANLAVTWKALGQDTNALDLMRDCLAKTKQALGIYHPDALSSSKTILE
ncbi:unnamed protein product [Penicillium salamii]|nr:unnamed protein product [Penicillium salamii]CAG8365467.1 unnamed protein product [Penicillium salamii]